MAQTEAQILEEISRLSGAINRHKSQAQPRGGYRGGRPYVPHSQRSTKPYTNAQEVVLNGQVFQSGRGGKSLVRKGAPTISRTTSAPAPAPTPTPQASASTLAPASGSTTTPQYVHAGKHTLIAANRVNKKPRPPPPAVLAAKRARLAKLSKVLNNVQAHRHMPKREHMPVPTRSSKDRHLSTLPTTPRPNACPSASISKTRGDVDWARRVPTRMCFWGTSAKKGCAGTLRCLGTVRAEWSVSGTMGVCATKGCKLPHVIRASRGKMEAAAASASAAAQATAAGVALAEESMPGAGQQKEGQQKLGDEFVSLMFEESEDEEQDGEEEEEGDDQEDEDEENEDLDVILSDHEDVDDSDNEIISGLDLDRSTMGYKDKRTKLPQSLLEEINSKGNRARIETCEACWRQGERTGQEVSEERKERGRKKGKNDYFSRVKERDNFHEKRAGESVDTRPAKKPRIEAAAGPLTPAPVSKPKLASVPQISKSIPADLELKPARAGLESGHIATKVVNPRLSPASSPSTSTSKKRTKDIEDDEIAWLEAKLGVSKKKGKQKGYGGAFSADGLDDILGDLDRIEMDMDMSGLGGDDDDLDAELEEKGDDGDQSDGSEGDEGDEGLDEEAGDQDSQLDESDSESDENQGESDEEVPTLLDPQVEKEQATSPTATQSKGAYVPPHLRQKADLNSAQTPEQVKLAHVTQALTSIILDSVSSSANLLDTFVILHAAFVAAIHKIIGIEFAAFFIENTVSSYETHWNSLRSSSSQNPEEPAIGSKESSNLLVLLSELYNFQVISCVLIYDLIRALLDSEFSEFDVELLLKVVKNSGQQMRQDDPLALKDIIQLVQDKMKGKRDNELSSRFRFMVETLVNLKNNKVKRATGTGQNVGAEAIERMKKYLGGINKKRHVMSHEPLRVSLEDLHTSSKRGKWWLVGSAWGGDPLVEKKATKTAQSSKTEDKGTSTAQATEQLMQLARQHGMNTEVRRNIFVVLVSSDDYVDACERLTQLDLQETQQREIIRVVLHCCGNERAYNPFYTLVTHHLCQKSHSHRITLQYCLWDFLRSLGETQVGGEAISRDEVASGDEVSNSMISNHAKAYAWWLARGSVALTIFKPVEFLVLRPRTKQFFRSLFAQMVISSQSNSPLVDVRSPESSIPQARNREAIQEIIAKAKRLPALCKGIGYFIKSMLSDEQDLKTKTKRAHELVIWGLSVVQDALQEDSLSDDDDL
ncbi:eukaryotic translation initiation factor 4G [Rhizoctonia solani]|uniref:Eukaryotic translation initiation factor 4G n=1 Tax=Rhizoctonia solani TaxID=456999 RepID=A0A8H8NQY0_9AGAM|nr:eukaryotic translation initiation factor 4G [Rhizoctonia solani]QRW16836.1 eukaryotic translation initiation factor 4G [Rhizoctonia solani]